MNVTRDVVIDLLALVKAGEASQDSKALVASWLKNDPELASTAEVRAARLSSPDVPATPGKEVEMRTLERTKMMLSWRSALVAVGVFFALFPVTFAAGSARPRWLLLESPMSGAISAGIALLAWGGFFWIRRKLRGRAS